jgi:hypothetical protein
MSEITLWGLFWMVFAGALVSNATTIALTVLVCRIVDYLTQKPPAVPTSSWEYPNSDLQN